LPVWTDFSLGPSTLVFTVALAGLVTLFAGLAPALRATHIPPSAALKDVGRDGSGIRSSRLTGALIVVQITTSVGFLSTAAMLGQSLLTYGFEQYGLPGEETLVAQIYFGWPSELNDPTSTLSDAQREVVRVEFMAENTRKREQIRRAILELPGVQYAAYGSRFPGNESERALVEVEGIDEPMRAAETARITDGYFELVGASAVGGRDLDAREYADGLDVVIVNEPFVRDRLHGVNAVGRRVRVVPENARNRDAYPWATVVGVVPDLGLSPDNPARAAAVYRPLMDINIMRLAIRGISEPGTWTPRLIEIANQVDPGIRVQWSRTLAAQMREPVALFRGFGIAFLILGGLALLLSAASIYALTAATVTRRTKELGIRQALGANAPSIVVTVLRRSSVQLVLGAALGPALALGLLRLGRVLPWEVGQGSPWALAAVAGLFALSSLAALAQPVRRALSIRPADAMRSE